MLFMWRDARRRCPMPEETLRAGEDEPAAAEACFVSPLHGLVPSTLVVNAILPALPHDKDGPCRQVILTCRLTERCCAELAKTAPQNGPGELNLKTAVERIRPLPAPLGRVVPRHSDAPEGFG